MSTNQPPSEQRPPHDPFLELPELLPRLSRRDFDLTQSEVDRLKVILEGQAGRILTNEEAWESARNLLRFAVLLLDIGVAQDRTNAGLPPRPTGVVPMPPPPPAPPTPQPFPIRLDADHRYEVESNLRMLEHELARTKTHPSSWRWAVVAAYNALGHALMLKHPAKPKDPGHHLIEMFEAAMSLSAISPWQSAIKRLELLRTAWLPRAVTTWPVGPQELWELCTLVPTITHALRGEEPTRHLS